MSFSFVDVTLMNDFCDTEIGTYNQYSYWLQDKQKNNRTQ